MQDSYRKNFLLEGKCAVAAASEKEEPKLNVETSVKEGEKWVRTISVTIPAADVNKEFNHVLGSLSGMVNLPGFRPGKVPRDIVEKRYGGDIKKQVTQNLLEKSITTAIDKEKLKVVGDPVFDVLKIQVEKNAPLAFEFGVEIFPHFELAKYSGLAIEQEEIDLLPEELEEAYKNILARYSEEADAAPDHAIADKDNAGGILRVLVEGKEIHKEEDARLLVVDGHVFGAYAHLGDKFLLGAKAGDKRTVEETLATGFPLAEFIGKKATLEFEVKSIKVLKQPELNDELAKKMEFPDLEALKEKVRTTLLDKIGDTIKDRTQDTLLRLITDNTKFELPERALARAASRNLENQVQQFSRMGYSLDQLGMDPEKFVANSKENSESELRRFFVLEALCEKEQIKVEDVEVEEYVVGMARQQNTPAQALFDKLYEEGQLPQIEASLRMKKAVEFIVDQAEIKIVPRKAVKPASLEGGHEHGEHAGHDHGGHEHAALAEHGGHEQGGHEDCGHDHGGHDCGHDHGGHKHAHEHEHTDPKK